MEKAKNVSTGPREPLIRAFHPVLKRQDRLGKEPLQDLAQWWRTSQGVDIPKISQFYWALFEKTRFFVFLHYKIKQKPSQNTPNSDFRGSKIPPRGANST